MIEIRATVLIERSLISIPSSTQKVTADMRETKLLTENTFFLQEGELICENLDF